MGTPDHPPYYLSAYALAQRRGFAGSLDEWLDSLTAYGIACSLGFVGSREAWIASLKGEKGDTGKSAYQYAVEAGYEGSEVAFAERQGNPGKSAFEYAQDGGFTGSLEQFTQMLAAENLMLIGGTMKGDINMAGFGISNLTDPKQDGDAATRGFVMGYIRKMVTIKETAVTLLKSGWTDNTQKVVCSIVGSNNTVIVTPGGKNFTAYIDANVRADGEKQEAGYLTFLCDEIPETDVSANVLVLNQGVTDT